MNEEQMRKEFEEWFCNEYLLGGGVVNYGCRTTYIAWNAWQASRKAMKPIKIENKTLCLFTKDVIEAIQQAGYKIEE